jgi:hypothetical protein
VHGLQSSRSKSRFEKLITPKRLQNVAYLTLIALLLTSGLVAAQLWRASGERVRKAENAGLFKIHAELLLEGEEGLIAQLIALEISEAEMITSGFPEATSVAFGVVEDFALSKYGAWQRIKSASISSLDALKLGLRCTQNELLVFSDLENNARVLSRADLMASAAIKPWQIEAALPNLDGVLCLSEVRKIQSLLLTLPRTPEQTELLFKPAQRRYAEGAVLSKRRLQLDHLGTRLAQVAEAEHGWTKLVAVICLSLALLIGTLAYMAQFSKLTARLFVEVALGLNERSFLKRAALASGRHVGLLVLLVSIFCIALTSLYGFAFPSAGLLIAAFLLVSFIACLGIAFESMWLRIESTRPRVATQKLPIARGSVLAAGVAVALTCALTLLSLYQHLAARSAIDLGFEPKGISTVEMWFPSFAGKSREERNRLWTQVDAAAQSVFGVDDPNRPRRSWIGGAPWRFEGHSQVSEGEATVGLLVHAGANLLAVLQADQRTGRDFTQTDMQSGSVVVAKLRPTQPVEQIKAFGEPIGQIKHLAAGNERIEYNRGMIVRPIQAYALDQFELLLRGNVSPAKHQEFLAAIQAVDDTAVIESPMQLTAIYARPLAFARSLSEFGSLALGLCVLVVFALIRALSGLWVQDNARDLALRQALGAGSRDALRLLLRQSTLWLVIGAVVGVVGFRAMHSVLQYKIYELQMLPDWLLVLTSIGLVALFAAAIAFLARGRLLQLNLAKVLQQG